MRFLAAFSLGLAAAIGGAYLAVTSGAITLPDLDEDDPAASER